MDLSNRELLRMVQGLLEATERKLAARYDKRDHIIDSCLTMGGTASSSSTSTWSDVCCVSEAPAPASPDSDADLVTVDAPSPAAPMRTTRSTGNTSWDITEPRPAPALTTAPTVHAATVGTVSVLAAPAAPDGIPDDQAISGVTSTTATCSTVCLHQHRVDDSVLVATPAEHVFDINVCVTEMPAPACSIPDQDTWFVSMGDTTLELLRGVDHEAIPMSATLQDSSSSVSIIEEAPGVDQSPPTGFIATAASSCSMDCMPRIPVTALGLVSSSPPTLTYDHEPVEPSSGQRISSTAHRPRPWPSFVVDHVAGDGARPLPWPSFRFSVSCDGNFCNPTSSITIHDMCSASDLRCSNDVLLFLGYWWSFGNYVQSVSTTLNWPSCLIPEYPLWVIVGSFKLKPFSNGAAVPVCLSCAQESGHYFCSSVVKELMILNLTRISPTFVLCDEWVPSPWDPGQAVVSDFATRQQAGFSYDQFSCANPNTFCLPGYLVTHGQIQVSSYDQFYCAIQDATYWHVYFATGSRMNLVCTLIECSIPSSDKLHEEMKPMAMSVSWQYLSHAELRENIPELLGKISRGWNYVNFSIGIVFSYLSGGVACPSTLQNWYLDHILLIPHKPRLACQGICKELSVCESSERFCWCAILRINLHWTSSWTDSGSLSDATVDMLSFCGKGHQLGFLLQGGTHADSPSLAFCELWLQNHKDTMLMRTQTGVSMQMNVKGSVQPIWLLTHAYQLCTLTPTMFSFAWGNLDCIFSWWNSTKDQWLYYLWCAIPEADLSSLTIYEVLLLNHQDMIQLQIAWQPCAILNFSSRTGRCALQVTSSELVFIVAFGGGQGKFHVEMRMSSSHTCTGNLPDVEQWDGTLNYLFNAIKGLPALIYRRWSLQGGREIIGVYDSYYLTTFLDKMHIDQDQVCADHDYSQHDLGGTKKRPLSWDPAGRYMKGLDRDMMLLLPWDPGVAAAAWGQAAFQGGRGVRSPSCTSPWAITWAILWAGPTTRNQLHGTNTRGTATRRASSWITEEPALSLSRSFSVSPSLALCSSQSLLLCI